MNSKLALALLWACTPVWAQSTAAPLVADVAPTRSEPNVRHTVIEDGGSKIDELRVRGQTQRLIVTPKIGTSVPYEIIVGPGGGDPLERTGGERAAVGKRVWNVLAF
jgi:hypothetical protein